MAKKKSDNEIFLTGCDLADGRRFEAGDGVPADLKKEDYEALKELGAIGEAEEK